MNIPLILSAIVLAAPLQAATLVFNGTLQGSQEVPAVSSAGSGSVILNVEDDTRAWTLTGSFSGLTGNSSNAHIHSAFPGVGGPVVVGLTFTSGVTAGTISGAGTFTPSQFTELNSGKYYVNLHSTAFGGGELRAQLVPEPSSALLGCLGAAMLLRRRRL
jgi:CHRD domain